jgi:hypothetical protein
MLFLLAAFVGYAAGVSRIPPADLRAYAFESAASASSLGRALGSRLALQQDSSAAGAAERMLAGPRRWSAWLRRLGEGDPQPSSEGVVACFMVDGADQVVCTEAPEEYAWYEGIDASDMQKVDPGLLVEGHMECTEGASYRGTPVWDCSKEADVR